MHVAVSPSWQARWKGGLGRFAAMLLVFAAGVASAHADVTLLLEEPIHVIGRLTSSGRATLWLSSICSDDEVHLRPCRADEAGTVLSRYTGAAGYDWLAIPPEAYLFAVSSPAEIPERASEEDVTQLRRRYEASHRVVVSNGLTDGARSRLLGASYRRTILAIHVRTTPEQDARLLAWLRERRNRSEFNLFWNNCADLSRQMLDVLFPGSIRRSYIFDVGIMTPEQLASGLSRYAGKHPELGMTIVVLPQIPGDIRRSGKMYGPTEAFVKTKPYLLPLTVLNPLEFGMVIASGLCDRRFDVQQHVKTAPRMMPAAAADDPDDGGQASGQKSMSLR